MELPVEALERGARGYSYENGRGIGREPHSGLSTGSDRDPSLGDGIVQIPRLVADVDENVPFLAIWIEIQVSGVGRPVEVVRLEAIQAENLLVARLGDYSAEDAHGRRAVYAEMRDRRERRRVRRLLPAIPGGEERLDRLVREDGLLPRQQVLRVLAKQYFIGNEIPRYRLQLRNRLIRIGDLVGVEQARAVGGVEEPFTHGPRESLVIAGQGHEARGQLKRFEEVGAAVHRP